MKTFLLLLAIIVPSCGLAQSLVGISAGISQLKLSWFEGMGTSVSKPGFDGEFFYVHNRSKFFGWGMAVNFSSDHNDLFLTPHAHGFNEILRATYHFNFLGIIPELQVTFPTSFFLQLAAGPYFGFLPGGKTVGEITGTQLVSYPPYYTAIMQPINRSVLHDFKSVDVGISVAARAAFRITPEISLLVQTACRFIFTGMMKSGDFYYQGDMHAKNISLTSGVMFDL